MAEMRQRGVAYIEYTDGRVRALTHYGIERADIERALRGHACLACRGRPRGRDCLTDAEARTDAAMGSAADARVGRR